MFVIDLEIRDEDFAGTNLAEVHRPRDLATSLDSGSDLMTLTTEWNGRL